jgi:hypothetical protein
MRKFLGLQRSRNEITTGATIGLATMQIFSWTSTRRTLSLMLLTAPLMQLMCANAWGGGSITIEREALLARGTGGSPYAIVRTPDGGFVIAGDVGVAWAARVDASGVLQWEYRDTRDESLRGPSQSAFDSAVVLADNSVLLCGYKKISNAQAGLVTRIGQNGQLLEQKLMRPNDDPKYTDSAISCLRSVYSTQRLKGSTIYEDEISSS